MLKKLVSLLCAIYILMMSISFYAFATTTINQDVSFTTPICSKMETTAEAQAVLTQLTSTNKKAELCEDRMEGNYSLKVVVGDETTNAYAQYTLASSAVFSIQNYSSIELWVKPGTGSDWIEFYTNNTIIKCDSSADGRFEVGVDLKAGEWNKITLDLNTAASITQGDDLVVRTNEYSTWYYDDIESKNTVVTPLNLTNMVNSSTQINNSNLEFKKTTGNTSYDTTPTVLTTSRNVTDPSINGQIQGIKIKSNYKDINGIVTTPNNYFNISNFNASSNAFSGNGNIIYYSNSNDSGKLYKFDLNTGISTKLSDSVTNATNLKTNYDGTYLCAVGTYSGSTSLVEYASSTGSITVMNTSNNLISYDLNNNGTVLSSSYSSLKFYLNTTLFLTLNGNPAAFDFKDYNSNFFYTIDSDLKGLYFYGSTSSGNYYGTKVYTADNAIIQIVINDAGDTAIFKTSTGVYSYNVATNIARKLNTNSGALICKVIDGNRLVIYDSGYYYYNLSTDSKTATSYDMQYCDRSGNITFYPPMIKYYNPDDKKNKYLFSFDGKNTWYSYKQGTWTLVSKDATPAASLFSQYGMLETEVNSLTQSDFLPLYENGQEIYSVDVATYFTSITPYVTPSISSINIITDKSSFGSVFDSTTTLLYTAKRTDFDGTQWRKVNQLYPVEISPKESEFIYFIYSNGKYQYYDGTVWHTETGTEISTLINSTDTNWLALKQIGMTDEQLREIPSSVLTTNLAGKSFSVVYCMRVADESTAGYYSNISTDYTKELFDTSKTLTLNIKLNDGSTMPITGISNTQIEDFMDWLNSHQNNKGATYYTIKSGATTYFINYYMILSVTVQES